MSTSNAHPRKFKCERGRCGGFCEKLLRRTLPNASALQLGPSQRHRSLRMHEIDGSGAISVRAMLLDDLCVDLQCLTCLLGYRYMPAAMRKFFRLPKGDKQAGVTIKDVVHSWVSECFQDLEWRTTRTGRLHSSAYDEADAVLVAVYHVCQRVVDSVLVCLAGGTPRQDGVHVHGDIGSAHDQWLAEYVVAYAACKRVRKGADPAEVAQVVQALLQRHIQVERHQELVSTLPARQDDPLQHRDHAVARRVLAALVADVGTAVADLVVPPQ